MKLYIANCTHQVQTVNYRLVEQKGRGWSTQHVEIGRQILIASPDLNTPQIEMVLRQLSLYGLRLMGEDWSRDGVKVPLIGNIENPVPHEMMMRVVAFNDEVMTKIGQKLREQAAIATSHGMRAYSPQAADNVAVSVEEEKPGTMDHGGRPGIAEGYRMGLGV